MSNTMEKIMNRPGRIQALSALPGMGEVLAPIKYWQRGSAVLVNMQDAFNAVPPRDTFYPDWRIRYVLGPESGNARQDIEKLGQGVVGGLFDALNIDGVGPYWAIYSFWSKEADAEFERRLTEPANRVENVDRAEVASTAEMWISPRAGTVLVVSSFADCDISGDASNAPRLFNSELIYQAWNNACYQYGSLVTTLKYVIISPVMNFGTMATMNDVLFARDVYSADEIEREETAEHIFPSGDPLNTSSDEFKLLMGTANARPIGRMCADHAATLNKKIKNIHVFCCYPKHNSGQEYYHALAFEMEDARPVNSQGSNTPQRKSSTRDKLKAFGKSVIGSIRGRKQGQETQTLDERMQNLALNNPPAAKSSNRPRRKESILGKFKCI